MKLLTIQVCSSVGRTVCRTSPPSHYCRKLSRQQNYTSISPKKHQHFFGVGVNSENSIVGGNECKCTKYTFEKPRAVWELHARTQSRATELRGAAKTRTRPGHRAGHRVQGRSQDRDKRRTRPGHRAGPQVGHRVQGRGKDREKRRTRPGHRAQPKQGQEEDKTRATEPSHSHRVQGAAKTRTRGGRDPDTEAGHRAQLDKDKRRTRPGHRAGPQSPATEFRGAASERGQLHFSKIEPNPNSKLFGEKHGTSSISVFVERLKGQCPLLTRFCIPSLKEKAHI